MQWDMAVVPNPCPASPTLSAELVSGFIAELDEVGVSQAFQTWLDGAAVRWRDTGELLTRDEAPAYLRLCRYIAVCCH